MTLAQLWVMHKSAPLKQGTWISNTFSVWMGGTGPDASWMTQKWIWLICSLKAYKGWHFMITCEDMYLQNTPQFILIWWGHTLMLILKLISISMLLHPSLRLSAATARVFAPLHEDYVGNPWLIVIWHDYHISWGTSNTGAYAPLAFS